MVGTTDQAISNCINRLVPKRAIPSFRSTLETLLQDKASFSINDTGEVVFDPILVAGCTHQELICIQLIIQAGKGDLEAIRMVMERMDGKPIQKSIAAEVSGTYLDFLNAQASELSGEVELL